jgi:hypothetical protein
MAVNASRTVPPVTELHGRIVDAETGRPLAARVRVLESTGESPAPERAMRKVGSGQPFFYSEGTFAVDVARGQADITVERGTEYRPLQVHVDVPASGRIDLDLPLERWIRMPEQGWYAGNTHVHYDETETRALERLRTDPLVEDLPVFIVSRLRRRELPYASNAFPIGRHELSRPAAIIDVGEETRHNRTARAEGYGHLMLVNLERIVEPLSRGLLVDDASPDYPPLIDACREAHAQGGLAIWCHNGIGMEAPIAAALGDLDGLNLFDPFWMDPEYELWYALLNCGMRLPASTGSDWFVSSSNRVYVDVGTDFSYAGWLAGLRAGRTFITDGPILRFTLDRASPSTDLLAAGPGTRGLEAVVEWAGAQPVSAVEIVADGRVVARSDVPAGALAGTFRERINVAETGWVAARVWGRARNSYDHALWAHTSPIHLRGAAAPAIRRADAASFAADIDRSIAWISTVGRFDAEAQRARILELFGEGRRIYEGLASGR